MIILAASGGCTCSSGGDTDGSADGPVEPWTDTDVEDTGFPDDAEEPDDEDEGGPGRAVNWARNYSPQESQYKMYLHDIDQAPDAGYIVAGVVFSDYLLLMKIDEQGEIEWARRATELRGVDQGGFVLATRDGGYFFGSIEVPILTSRYAAYAVKTDASGNMVWGKSLNSLGTQPEGVLGFDWVSGAVETADGGYILGGWTSHPHDDGQAVSTVQNAWLVKIDGSGGAVWSFAYRYPEGSSRFGSLQPTPDGRVVFIGAKDPEDPDEVRGMVVGADGEGAILWQKEVTIAGRRAVLSGIAVSPDGGYVVTGYDADLLQSVVIKLGGDASLQWARSSAYAQISTLFPATAGAGAFEDFFLGSRFCTSATPPSCAFTIASMSLEGNLAWQRIYGDLYQGARLLRAADGGAVMAVSWLPFLPETPGSENLWIIKTDERGEVTEDCMMGSIVTAQIPFEDVDVSLEDTGADIEVIPFSPTVGGLGLSLVDFPVELETACELII